MPEATISRSFELKDFKTGAARMALEAEVPTIPLIVWGAQRIWTKDHPRNVGRKKIPVIVAAGRPLPPSGDVEHLDAALRAGMTTLLHRVQDEYPHPEGAIGCRSGWAAAHLRWRRQKLLRTLKRPSAPADG